MSALGAPSDLPPWVTELLNAGSQEQLREAAAARRDLALLFPLWSRVPPEQLSDRNAVAQRGTRIGELVRLLAQNGEAGPLNQLQEESRRRVDSLASLVNRASALETWGRPHEALSLLDEALPMLEQVAMDQRVASAVSTAYYVRAHARLDLGMLDEASSDARAARRAFHEIDRPRKAFECLELLQIIQALQLPTVNPVEGRALVACRETVASAQAAYDDSKLDHCLRLLRMAAAVGERSEMWYDYTLEGKVLGLRGIALWALGQCDDAIDITLHALVCAWLIDDALSVGVYEANLTQMRAEPASSVTSKMHGVREKIGITTKSDALRWAETAAADGDLDCAYWRGVAWLGGPPTDQDRAVMMLETAARGGHIRAALRLGHLYIERGEKERARHWFASAADAGCTSALMPLARVLMDSHDEAEIQLTVRLIREAAAAGDPHAQEAMMLLNEAPADGRSDV